MKYILKNPETGETKEVSGKTVSYILPWFVEKVIKEPEDYANSPRGQTEAKLAVWAVKHNLPLAAFLDAARWLLQKDCPFCQTGTQVLRAIGELGTERAEKALAEILTAKERNDIAALEQIRNELWSSEAPASPPQS